MDTLNLIPRKKRGNPKWGKAMILVPQSVPEFEKLLAEMGLGEDECLRSFNVRKWIRANLNRRYVPEHLLVRLGLEPHVTFCGAGEEKL